jgi:hypothetical protein
MSTAVSLFPTTAFPLYSRIFCWPLSHLKKSEFLGHPPVSLQPAREVSVCLGCKKNLSWFLNFPQRLVIVNTLSETKMYWKYPVSEKTCWEMCLGALGEMPHSTYIEQHLMGTGSMLGNAEIVLPRDDILLDQHIDVVIFLALCILPIRD